MNPPQVFMSNLYSLRLIPDKRTTAKLLCLFVAVLAGLLFAPSLVYAQSGDTLSDGKVHVEVMPYLVLGGLSGDLTIRGKTVPVNASAGDVLSNLSSAFMGRAAVSYNRWFTATDVLYMGLGGTGNLPGPASIGVNASADQWAAEAQAGYRIDRRINVFGGVRYNNLTSRFNFQGPLGIVRSGSFTWWDPFFGAQGELPLRKKLSVSARFDLGGFGVGSHVAVNAEPMLNYNFNRRFSSSFGWKFFYQDYKNTTNNFEYDMLTQGPFLGLTIRF